MKPDFTLNLLSWNASSNKRHMPWKGEPDPYRIWLSEIILQQTRVEQGLSYYEKFITAYPTITDLARTHENEVFKLWEGLGYYSRCKNLIATARHIADNLNGIFPCTYNDILQLKGVGPYTAAAIASFAFNECYAVVDGNVQRVLARYFGISTPIDSAEGKKLLGDLANALIDTTQPAIYNQAIMDFGATICKPRNPLCGECTQRDSCEAYRHRVVDQLPIKEKSLVKRTRWLYYFIVRHNDEVFIRKRNGNDIWQNLHEFVLFESPEEYADLPADLLKNVLGHSDFSIEYKGDVMKQQLTHQNIRGRFIKIRLHRPATINNNYMQVNVGNIHEYAFPRFINSFLDKHPI